MPWWAWASCRAILLVCGSTHLQTLTKGMNTRGPWVHVSIPHLCLAASALCAGHRARHSPLPVAVTPPEGLPLDPMHRPPCFSCLFQGTLCPSSCTAVIWRSHLPLAWCQSSGAGTAGRPTCRHLPAGAWESAWPHASSPERPTNGAIPVRSGGRY